MIEKKKKHAVIRWVIRAGYLFSLLTIAIICTTFYFEQQQASKKINKLSLVNEQLFLLGRTVETLAVKASRISEVTPKVLTDPFAKIMTQGVLRSKREKVLRNVKPAESVLSMKRTLKFYQAAGREELDKFRELWANTDPEFTSQIIRTSQYMKNTDPFLYYETAFNSKIVETSRFPNDLYWIGRSISEVHTNHIIPSNQHIAKTILDYEKELNLERGALLKNFMLIALAALFFIGFFIFLPLDICMNKMFNNILEKTKMAEEQTRRAELADQSKSDFLANMSHEIRTPMNGVMGMAELLSNTKLDNKQQMFADIIVKSGQSLLVIINDILDFSKISAGQLELDPAPFDLITAVEDVAMLISSKASEKDVELLVSLDPTLPLSVNGDVGRIRQILTNLAGNAIKFTEQGEVIISVSNMNEQKANSEKAHLKIAVKDTGVGIPKEKCEAVFEKFSQVDTSATRKHEGTGLGLSIAASLIKLMGGKIHLESEVGKGSTFWFTIELPICEDNPKPFAKEPTANIARILVVDDNETSRDILATKIANWGYESAATKSGAEALAFLDAANQQGVAIDLILLDYQMPHMTGGDFLSKLKVHKPFSTIPVVMMMTTDGASLGQSFYEIGLSASILKPVRTDALRQTIESLLDEENQNSGQQAAELLQDLTAA